MRAPLQSRQIGFQGCPYCGDAWNVSSQRVVSTANLGGHYNYFGVYRWTERQILECGHIVDVPKDNIAPGYTFPGS